MGQEKIQGQSSEVVNTTEDPRVAVTEAACPVCFGLGWVLDCNDLGKPGPRHVEFIRCFYPACNIDEQIGRLVFKGIRFQEVSRHARDRFVMSLGRSV